MSQRTNLPSIQSVFVSIRIRMPIRVKTRVRIEIRIRIQIRIRIRPTYLEQPNPTQTKHQRESGETQLGAETPR